jgi:Tol biopolymer transport system component
LISLDTGNVKRLTNVLDTIDNGNPKWSPDGRQIAFVSRRDGDANIYIMNSDGTIQERLVEHSGYDAQFNWSPDGSEIVFVFDRDGNSEIYKMNIYTKEITRLTFEPASDGEPAWSSDGKRIAFVSSRAPGPTVFIMNAYGENVEQITEASIGYARPVWCPDDKCLIVEKTGRNWYSKNELILLDLDTKEDRPLVINHPQISSEAIIWYATVSKIRKFIVFWALSDKMNLMYALDMHKNELHSLGVQGCAGDLFP